MKATYQILMLALLLAACRKDEPVNKPVTVTWKLNTQSDYLKQREFDHQIEYYDENHRITHKEYYSADTVTTATYSYNNEGQLVAYNWELYGAYRYSYENGLLLKKEYLDHELKFLQYSLVYEYTDEVLQKQYYYNRYGTLKSIIQNYYSSGNLDSTYHYFTVNPDSIEGKAIYTYDGNHHKLGESNWKWSNEKREFYPVSKISYEYENDQLTRIDARNGNNELLGLLYVYKYDDRGRKNRIEMYYYDQFLGSYDAAFSSNIDEYIIPEL